jgi:hypothetical protein
MPFTETFLTLGLGLAVALYMWFRKAVSVMAIGVFAVTTGSVIVYFTTGAAAQFGLALGTTGTGIFIGGAVIGLLKLFYRAVMEDELQILST